MNNKNEKIMNNEIRKRLESAEWDRSIARKVLERKKGTRKKIFYSASFGGLAAAAAVTVIFLFGIRNADDQDNYMRFISKQVLATYSSVNGNGGSVKISPYGDDLLASDDIEEIIDETMAVR